MKFVCDNCKAKYQIGDEKVAGKTVRMKCRKCGYDIKVSASTGSSLSAERTMEASISALVEDAPMSMLPAPAPSGPRPASGAPPAPAARGTWANEEDESTSLMNAPVRDAVAAVTAPRAPTPL